MKILSKIILILILAMACTLVFSKNSIAMQDWDSMKQQADAFIQKGQSEGGDTVISEQSLQDFAMPIARTLLAIAIFFFKDWIDLIKGGYKQVVKKEKSTEGRMFWYIVIATIPGGIIGFILDHIVGESLGEMPLLIAIALIVMGIILYIVDKKAPSNIKYEDMTFKQTFLIGLSQALAFIPGVSRSGITMTTGRLMGVDRSSTAKYSFMLSAPIVLGATLYKFKDFVFNLPFVVGVLSSFIVGLLVIKFLLQYLQKGSFKVFAIYRIVVGIAIIILFMTRI